MMRPGMILLAALAPLLATSGCIFGCGGYSGGSDRVYQTATDQLILCENGGFVAMANGSITLQGFYSANASTSAPGVTGTDGPTGGFDFDLTDNTDGTVSIPQLAPGEWQQLSPDPAELDHYNYYCNQLTSQSWWATPPSGSGSNLGA